MKHRLECTQVLKCRTTKLLEFIKLDLVLGVPQKCTSFLGKLMQSHDMVLEVRDEKGKLVAETKE